MSAESKDKVKSDVESDVVDENHGRESGQFMANEAERVRELHRYSILDTPDEMEFDDLTKLASFLCDAPYAQINFLDNDREWCKSGHGWELRQIARNLSVCTHTIQQERYLVVNDMSRDPRFTDVLAASEKDARFYAGVVLKSSKGYNIGTLCVFDTMPRDLTSRQLEGLQILARAVETQLELRMNRDRLSEEHRKLGQAMMMLHHSTDIRLMIGPKDLKIRQVNEEVSKLLGYSADEMTGTPFTDYIPRDAQKMKFERWAADDRHPKFITEAEFCTKKGEVIWLQVNMFKEEDLLYATAKNITRRKRTEHRFLKQMELTEDIIQHLPGIFYLVNRNGGMRKWNLNFEDVTNRSAREMKDRAFTEFIAPEDRKAAKRMLERIFEEGFARTELRTIAGDGGLIPFLLVGFRFRYDEGMYAIGFGINITEEKMALAELELKERNLKEAQRIGKIGSWTWHVPTCVITLSDEVYKLFGLARETFTPTVENFMDLLTPDNEKMKVQEIVRKVTSGEDWKEAELRVVRPDGTVAYIYERGEISRDSRGNAVEVSGTMQDVTDRRENEEKVSTALHEKEVLLREIHHRVKNNLAIISGLIQLEIFNTDDENLKFVLSSSQMRIKSMALIHESLYSTSNLADISFGSYLEEFATLVKETFVSDDRDVKLIMDTADLSLNITQAIPCALLVNELLINALKHAFPGEMPGTIRVTLRMKDEIVQLSVADDGAGMDPQVDIENPKTLGLTLVVSLTRQLNGTLHLNRDGGTSFAIQFPRMKIAGGESGQS